MSKYRERFNIQGRKVEYIGMYIELYGLTDLFIDFYYEELLRYKYISTASAIAGTSNEKPYGVVDKKLRCVAETAEGRKVLSNFTYWGNSFHFASKGNFRMTPDWYIHPRGPAGGYMVGDKIYSEYLYKPLSKEEFYKRNAGKNIPPPPSAFQSIFTGVSDIFAKTLGLGRLLPDDKVKEINPVREKLDLGLFEDYPVGVDEDEEDAAGDAQGYSEDIDYVAMHPPPPGGIVEYIPATQQQPAPYDPTLVPPHLPQHYAEAVGSPVGSPIRAGSPVGPGPSPSMPALVEATPPPKRPVRSAPPPPMPTLLEGSSPLKMPPEAIKKSNLEKMIRSADPEGTGKIELIVPVGNKEGAISYPDFNKEGEIKTMQLERPKDPEDLAAQDRYANRYKPILQRELDKIDQIGDDQIEEFADELGVKFKPTEANVKRRLLLKKELVNKTAHQMGVSSSKFSSLITFPASKGESIQLLPSDVKAIEDSLNIMKNRHKFLKVDLLSYAELYNIDIEPKATADELRQVVIRHYIGRAELTLTVEEEKKFQERLESIVKKYTT